MSCISLSRKSDPISFEGNISLGWSRAVNRNTERLIRINENRIIPNAWTKRLENLLAKWNHISPTQICLKRGSHFPSKTLPLGGAFWDVAFSVAFLFRDTQGPNISAARCSDDGRHQLIHLSISWAGLLTSRLARFAISMIGFPRILSHIQSASFGKLQCQSSMRLFLVRCACQWVIRIYCNFLLLVCSIYDPSIQSTLTYCVCAGETNPGQLGGGNSQNVCFKF